MNGAGMKPRTELTLTIRPLPCSRICGRTARVMRIEPKRLVSNSTRACSIELSSAAPETPTPALFTSTSMRPDRSSTSRTTAATDSSSVTSSGRNRTPPCVSPAAALRLVPYTVKPAPTSARAAASPIPADAPVTSATRSASTAMISPHLDGITIIISSYARNTMVRARRRHETTRSAPAARGPGTRSRTVRSEVAMRYKKDHKQATRRRILEAAGRRLQQDGIDGAGVAAVMSDAGLTNGAFYAHFASKEDLVANVLADQLQAQRQSFEAESPDRAGLEAFIRAYLSPQHRDQCGDGCPSAALLDEIVRRPAATRQVFTDELLGIADDIGARLDPPDADAARTDALTLFALMIGILQLARALTDGALSDQLLTRGVETALQLLDNRGMTAS